MHACMLRRRSAEYLYLQISSFKALKDNMTVFGSAGPTHDEQPVFCWGQTKFEDPHYMHPDCFGFPWEAVSGAENFNAH